MPPGWHSGGPPKGFFGEFPGALAVPLALRGAPQTRLWGVPRVNSGVICLGFRRFRFGGFNGGGVYREDSEAVDESFWKG